MPKPPQTSRRPTARRRSNNTADQMIGDSVKALRERRGGMSQQALADALGWTQSTVARIESGQRQVTASDLLSLCWALDVAPVFVLDGSFQTGDVSVHKSLRVPTPHMRKWIRGGEPLPGMNYRAYFENVPDDEWIERYGPVDEQRSAAAQTYERAEDLLAAGARAKPEHEQGEAELEPERRARLEAERERRKTQLDASRRAKKGGGKR